MKKNSILSVIVLLTAFLSVCGQERISLSIDESREIQLPFAIQSYKVTPQEILKAETLAENKLAIRGVVVGECELLISGGSLSKRINVTVVSNLKKILRKLKNDLQELSELDIAVNEDIITLRGSLSKYEKWKYLKNVLASYNEKTVRSYVKFVPSAETVINLKKSLESLGYAFSDKDSQEPGVLCMKMSNDIFFLSGQLYSNGEKDEIMKVLQSQAWMALDDKTATTEDGKIKAMIRLSVLSTQVVVDVGCVALSKNDVDTLGNQSGKGPVGNIDFGILYDIVSGRATKKTASFGADLTQTVEFLSKSGITRTYKAGSVSFTNGSKDGGYLKIGGTHYVKVSGIDSGDLKEINYGFILTIKGEILNRRQIRLTVDLENSHYAEMHKEEKNIKTERIVEFNKTAMIGGFRDITREIGNSGLPVLRNTPVLQWFVAQQKDSETRADLLILVSPRVSQDTDVEIPVTRKPDTLLKESQQSNSEYKKSNKKYSGWLYWLNWFVW